MLERLAQELRFNCDSLRWTRGAAPIVQKIVKIRRDYNAWVANETMEDYALRFAPRSFRRWSPFWVGNTAFGAVSFLALEAIGGALIVSHGFTNAVIAIVSVGVIIGLLSWPIAYYAAKYNVDIDLLTRGAGFGYLGSTVTSLIYASFTFIFFAIEAAIMALALELYFGLPLSIGYVVSALVVIPLVLYGITAIGVLQRVTQPAWLILMVLPFIAVAVKNPAAFSQWTTFGGGAESGNDFSWLMVGAATTVVFSLVAQIGEQVDYLRFLPPRTVANRRQWWGSLLIAGPGWIVLGMAKMLGGAFLAFLVLQHELPIDRAVDPTQMYLVAYQYVFEDYSWALAFTVLFVVLSQLKINVTNAYAGSLAWSNFFSRITHNHPGRVVWLVFNVLIALMLMELGVFDALESVLGLYANLATAWIGALVADLVINKPLGLSPPGIEFKRAHLYDINPVGLGATIIASALAIAAYFGMFGEMAQAFSPFVALVVALVSAPLIAWLTQGRYYLLRQDPAGSTRCCVCDNTFESEDMASCPAYGGAICSLCCTLDSRCHDLCKPYPAHERYTAWHELFTSFTRWSRERIKSRVWRFIAVFSVLSAVFALVLAAIYYQAQHHPALDIRWSESTFEATLIKLYAVVLLLLGVGVWWLVLTAESRDVAEEELNRHNALLQKEVEDHHHTSAQLQKAKEVAESASLAKSRFLTDMSHELRSPLNVVLGYAQLLEADAELPPARRVAARVIRESGLHILTIIDDILDIARIEARRLRLVKTEFAIAGFLHGLVSMFKPQAEAKGLGFRLQIMGELPRVVKGDERRLRQILINLLSNAVRYTRVGEVTLRVTYATELAHFVVSDTGPGISESDVGQLFQPFFRSESAPLDAPDGTGLGLVISKMLVHLMGGDLVVESTAGVGATFTLHVFLPEGREHITSPLATTHSGIIAYHGPRRTVLVVDDQSKHRKLISEVLSQLGFKVLQSDTGEHCLNIMRSQSPDLILMDLRMPGFDGVQTTRALRTQGYKGPIFTVTAHAQDQHREEMSAAGADDFISKPIQIERLLTQLRVHLGLDWIYAEDDVIAAQQMTFPPATEREQLRKLAEMGHAKAVGDLLLEIEQGKPECGQFVHVARQFTKEFRLRDLAQWIGA